MYLAYIDESGDPGECGSKTYVLACVFLPAIRWPDVFDDLIDFRRFLSSKFRIPVRAEIKANHLLQNHGVFRDLKLSEKARFAIYRGCMRIQPKLGIKTFAVVIDKKRLAKHRPNTDPRYVAWEFLLQRLERLTTTGNTGAIVIHDEGEELLVRKLARKARRAGTAGSAFGTGMLKLPARLLLDDPVAKNSYQSYFLQLADLSAYAAFRRLYPPPARRVQIVPRNMWDELGTACYGEANYLVRRQAQGQVPGIVHWPRLRKAASKEEPPVSGG